MSLLNFNSIPGFAEAANEETANREIAFFRSPPPLAGLPVRHYSCRHHLLLVGCRNRFITGGLIRPEDVAMFLWFLSPEYVEGNSKARAKFIRRRVSRLNYNAVRVEIETFLARALQDWPASSMGSGKRDYTASVAVVVDRLATEYGWSDEVILEMPLARLFQYLRVIQLRNDPKALMFNPTDRLVSKYLRERMDSAPAGN